MAVRIRLSRIGRKKTPFYNLVAIDSRSKRDGAFLSDIGTYDGLKGEVVHFKEDIYNDWIAKGAIPSDSAKRIYRAYKRIVKSREQGSAKGAPDVGVKKEASKSVKAPTKPKKSDVNANDTTE